MRQSAFEHKLGPQYGQLLFFRVLMACTSLCCIPLNCATWLIEASCVLPMFMASSRVRCSFLPNNYFCNPGNLVPTMSCSINLSVDYVQKGNMSTNRYATRAKLAFAEKRLNSLLYWINIDTQMGNAPK